MEKKYKQVFNCFGPLFNLEGSTNFRTGRWFEKYLLLRKCVLNTLLLQHKIEMWRANKKFEKYCADWYCEMIYRFFVLEHKNTEKKEHMELINFNFSFIGKFQELIINAVWILNSWCSRVCFLYFFFDGTPFYFYSYIR